MKKLLFLLFSFSLSLHAAPYHKPPKQINVFLVGSGLVGKTFLNQLRVTHDEILEKYDLDIRVVGIANRRGMCFYLNGFPLDIWADCFEQYNETMSLSSFIARFCAMHLPHSLFVDCSADQQITEFYPSIMKCGISIVTPNKKANSGSLQEFAHLQELALVNGVQFLYDANVGAGLPIVHALQNLNMSGDTVTKFEAMLSGTLSSIFYAFQEEGKTFSEAVLDAQQKGYTEPDPRDDLNGQDVVRKVLILARTAGIPLEKHHIEQQKLLPDSCYQAESVEDFYANLKTYDAAWEYMKQEAASQGKKLRYIAKFEQGKATIRLETIDATHPFYRLKGSDNSIAITSHYYPDNPLVIQGPGAGAVVTASKVLANVVQVARAY